MFNTKIIGITCKFCIIDKITDLWKNGKCNNNLGLFLAFVIGDVVTVVIA